MSPGSRIYCHILRAVAHTCLLPTFARAHPPLSSARSQQGRYHVYEAAKAATKATFQHHLDQVKKLNAKAAEKLDGTPHHTWANYACRDNVIQGQITSNSSEAVNNMIGAEVKSHVALRGELSPLVFVALMWDASLWYWNRCQCKTRISFGGGGDRVGANACRIMVCLLSHDYSFFFSVDIL